MTVTKIAAGVERAQSLTSLVFTDRGTSKRTIALNPADRTLVGYDLTARKLIKSSDDGATWSTLCNFVFPWNSVSGVAFTDDGEVIASLSPKNDNTNGGRLYKSTGWAANPLTATFAIVLDAGTTKVGVYYSSSYGGVSAAGALVLATEYGPKTSAGMTTAALKAWLSTDYGATFTQVFDLSTTPINGTALTVDATTDNHLHGGLVDPYWDRLWICFGDAVSSVPHSYKGIIYSDDHGATWSAVPGTVDYRGDWQVVAPFACKTGVTFLSDLQPPGVSRIGRRGWRRATPIHALSLLASVAGVSWVGRSVTRAGFSGAPIIAALVGGSDPIIGKIVVSWDEETWFTVYTDANTIGGGAHSVGLQGAWGPTNTGKLVAEFSDTTRFANGARMTADLPSRVPDVSRSQASPARFTSGLYYAQNNPTRAKVGLTLNRLEWSLFVVGERTRFVAVTANVDTGIANGIIRAGLWHTNFDNTLGALLLSSDLDASGSGVSNAPENVIDITLEAGVYALGGVAQVAAATQVWTVTGVPAGLGGSTKVDLLQNSRAGWSLTGVSGALTDSPTPNGRVNNVIAIALKAA